LVALVARALEEAHGLDDFMPARLTVDLFKAARGVETTATTRLVRDGRRVRNSECELIQDGVVVVRAVLVQYRRSSAPRGEEWSASMDFTPPPDIDSARHMSIGSDDGGWSHVIADHQNTSRKRTLQPHRRRRLGRDEHAVRERGDGRRGHEPGHQSRLGGRGGTSMAT
jgi:hypothetical protein